MRKPDLSSPTRTILPALWGFAFLSYLLRTNIAVAQQFMARELSLDTIQVGYIFTAFLVGYTIFQVPAGILGDRFGPRVVLLITGLGWATTTLFTGVTPGLLIRNSAAALVALLVIRFLHGIEESATYPVAMTAVSAWFPASQYALLNSLIFTGSTLGAAFGPPLVASLMNSFGWRATFYWTALLPLVLALIWWNVTPGRPDRGVSERAGFADGSWRALLLKWNVLLLSLSYLLYCYAISIFVYWLFKYLVDVRHLSVVNGGWATSLPWIVASGAVPLFGYLTNGVSHRIGKLPGRRLVAASCLVIAAALMFAGAEAVHLSTALVTISLSVGLLFSTEAPYWSTAIDLAPDHSGAASGLMNLAGNLGGVLSTLLVPVLVTYFGWFIALLSGSVFALFGALLWFFIRAEPQASLTSLVD
ncbi:MAG TPA: MFS transporter [Bryobacteraceae bacterium]|nr:MFS transporter [Bryobacteraceae bacterium]